MLIRALGAVAAAALLLNAAWAPVEQSASAFSTRVDISGTQFLVNGARSNSGTAAEGLLLNVRMVQAIFDDENPQTVDEWEYPDTKRWDLERNVSEFIAALPTYA